MSVLEKIKKYCAEKEISIASFERMCGIGNGTIDDWDKSNPSITSLLKIEKATGISITEWLKGEK